jgi:hypothetical protein
MKKILLLGAFVFLLSACVVQDDNEENEATGLWTGTTTDVRSVTTLVLGDGTSYFFYSPASDATITAGVIRGAAVAENGAFTLTNGIHLSTTGAGTVNSGTIGGTYNSSAMNVVMTATGIGSVSFSGASQNEFDNTPSLTTVAGDYTGTITLLGLSETVDVEILDTGSVTIDSANCDATGTITPASSGNFYSVSLTTTTCTGANANSSFSGHAILRSGTRLFLFAPNAGSTSGILIDAD